MLSWCYSQDTATSDFFTQVKSYDLSTVLMTDSILDDESEEGIEKFKRAEILGFIGDDYQRFYIHFVSVIQNPTNPYEYLVYGKTKVKESICSFQGSLTIKQAQLYRNSEIPGVKQGFANCELIIYEDRKQSSSGFIKGTLITEFVIDSKGLLRYDALNFAADGFSNNQFIGTWTSYTTNSSKKCHWGDYRIPDCGDLDVGAGEFSINDFYLRNGWTNYRLAWGTYPETTEVLMARLKENEQWWK